VMTDQSVPQSRDIQGSENWKNPVLVIVIFTKERNFYESV
jgi:hypothetical protein